MVGPQGNVNMTIVNPAGATSEENPMQVNESAIGTKADAAVTDYETDGTVIALTKGITTKLQTMKTIVTPII